MLSTITPIGASAKYGTTPSPSGSSVGLAVLGLDPDQLEVHSLDIDPAGCPRPPAQRERNRCRHVGLGLDRLVDGHRLLAEEDVLDPAKVASWPLTVRLSTPGRLHSVDRRVREPVVRGEDRVDLVVLAR